MQTVGDVGQSIPCIYEVVYNRKAEHQASIIEMDGKVCDQVISIFIDPVSYYSYVRTCGLNKELHAKSWLVKLASVMKEKVHHWVRDYSFELNGMPTTSHLNVLPLGSYSNWAWIGCIYIEPR